MFAFEYRVCDIKRGHILAEPLDGAGAVNVWIASPQRYVENEIVILSNLEERKGGFKAQVIASRTDPSFLKSRPLELIQVSEELYELEEYPSSDQAEAFEEALEIYRAECFDEAAAALRQFLKRYPLHIDSYHHLGNIEWKEGRLSRALKYYEMGHRIGLLCLPIDFRGHLSWKNPGNRPFLRATHAYALLLNRKRRLLEACKICERLLVWDPGDRLGIRDLLPRYYFEANAPALARTFLETQKTVGMNHYTLGLLRLMEGRRREALRSLCAAVTYNPYVILFLLGERTVPEVDHEAEYVTVGGESEAAEYLMDFARHWRKDRYIDFVRLVMKQGSPFRRRFDRFLHIKEQLDRVRDFPVRERLIAEKQKILNEDDVRALLREAADSIFS
jgi:tetratricopeptide (TPR) repeat protein